MPIETIPDLFLSAVHERPRPDCFAYRTASGDYVNVSSAEALQRVRALRQGLHSLGVRKGDRVALLSENRLEWALSDLAILATGAVTVPVYPTLLSDSIEYILRDCEPTALFLSTPEQAEKIHRMRDRLPFLRDVITFDEVSLPSMLPFEQLARIGGNVLGTRSGAPGSEWPAVDKHDLASIIYTSGTTGDPKGVMLSHWNFVSNVLAVLQIVSLKPGDRCLSFLPLSHVLERTAGFYMMLCAGVGIAYAERVDTVPRDLLEVRPTIVISVPRLYEKIYARVLATAMAGGPIKRNLFFWAREVGRRAIRLELAGQPVPLPLRVQRGIADQLVFHKLRARTGGRLRFFVSGGAPLSPTINEFFHAAGLTILEGYGLTETAPVLAVNTLEHLRIGTVGRPIPGTEIRIAEDGEILARGPQVMRGYHRDEQATREVLDEEGWLATGDIGNLDADGFLTITDRKKDVIVTAGGKNVAPQPIENKLMESKFIAQAVVIGDQRPYLSCLIVPDFEQLANGQFAPPGVAPDRDGLLGSQEVKALFAREIQRVNDRLPGFSQIKRHALLPREFTLEAAELTPTMKVRRSQVTAHYRELIDTLYAGDEG
jgi:long-chain acyl-CoA synthetase